MAHVGELVNLILLGLIEGVTEFLPISSTGHLLIAERWLGHRSEVFNVVIQAGAILAVVLIYRQRLWELATRSLPRTAIIRRPLRLRRRLTAVAP